MYQIILMVHVLVAIVLIGLVLIQHGKGADIGASFGAGASSTVFGSQGTGGFLFKLTSTLAIAFFATSLTLSYLVATQHSRIEPELLPQSSTSADTAIPVPEDGKE